MAQHPQFEVKRIAVPRLEATRSPADHEWRDQAGPSSTYAQAEHYFLNFSQFYAALTNFLILKNVIIYPTVN